MPDEAEQAAKDDDGRAGDFERYALIAALTLVVLCLLLWDRGRADERRPTAPRPDRTLRVEIGGGSPAKTNAPAPATNTTPDPPPRPAPQQAPPAAPARTYVVKSGDTLYDIARQELGSSSRAKEIVELNAITDDSKLKIGQVLTLPAK